MVTALGFNAPATLAALGAGVTGIAQVPWLDSESGKPLRGAKVALPQWWEGLGKLADLAAPAINECLQAAAPESADNVPILLGVAEADRPGRTEALTERLLGEIELRLSLGRHRDSRVYPYGQVGCVIALQDALQIIGSGRAKACVVAGVDSFLHQPTLDAYIARRRLMTASNSNGFFPGEAACAVLVAAADSMPRDELRLLGMGRGFEPATINGVDPLRAVGMTQATRQALESAGIALQDVAFRITDLSGEHYKFKEALFVLTRLDRGVRQGALDLWHPIEYLGEIGAAILPCILGWALHSQQFGYAPGPLVLCHVGSDDGQRAAIIAAARLMEEASVG
jgi:3-oxoacyl-[acyl-carrier-protein] synthase-1